MAAVGIVVGVGYAMELTGLARKLLYGVQPNDPVSIGGAGFAGGSYGGIARGLGEGRG